MCGVIGCTGNEKATDIVFEGLKKLEYRGYDSWGIATDNSGINITKKVGKISDSENMLPACELAIGHSRWATHGGVTESNAHPHTSCDGKIAVVHNGIVENFQELRAKLKNHKFVSETDTEVIPHLIEEKISLGFVEAVKETAKELEGRFAFIAIQEGDSRIVAARRGSPLVLGIGDGEYYVASDIPAFLDKTNKVVFLEDNQVAVMNHSLHVFDLRSGKEVESQVKTIDWESKQAEKGNYEHFMLKEIFEQRYTIKRALSQNSLDIIKTKYLVENARNIFLVGAGTAGSVCFLAEYLFAHMLKKKANYIPAGEFNNYAEIVDTNDVMFVVSQSGETADALEAIELAEKKGCKIVSIVNVQGSTITRESDITFLINAGPEKAVASTKATTAQMAVFLMLCSAFKDRYDEGVKLLEDSSIEINKFLTSSYADSIKTIAEKIKHHEHMYIIGRGLQYPLAKEASIKIQEVGYVKSLAFSGSELKHGPIALITKGSLCLAIVPEDETKKDMISNILELKSRGAKILAIGSKKEDIYDYFIPAPTVGYATPILSLVPIQLLAYFLSILRGNDPDYPRNLAKSVTVK